MVEQPSGTVTLVFTDIEGSTRLLHELGEQEYREALAEHRRIVREACACHGGYEVDYEGDSFFYAFRSAREAVTAVEQAMRGLAGGPIRLRVGIHTGEPGLDPPKYVGLDVHRAARIMSAGHGGQVLLSATTRELLDCELTELGDHRLKDFREPEALFQLGSQRFPPLKTVANTNLPRPASSFVGREREVGEVISLVRGGARLLTLSGPGGAGKTRVAIEAAAELVGEFKAGVFWVGLAPLRDPALLLETVALTFGAKGGLAGWIGERELLLLLDNLEQVIEAAPELVDLVEACPNLHLLVTSRELLRVRGELDYPVLPLASADAVALFAARAHLEPDEAVRELCRRLDNLPLALELAAARTAVLSPAQILNRLSRRLDLFKGGRDADPRQETLRATIDWSYGLLTIDEQRLFRRLAVFAGGCTLEAAEQVADAHLDLLQSLVDKSVLRHSGERFWMHETIREYASEQVQADSDHATFNRRHADYYTTLCETSATAFASADPAAARMLVLLQAEQDNLRAALAWTAETDIDALRRLVLAATHLWMTQDNIDEGERWIESVLARSESEAATVRARLLHYAAMWAEGRGDLERALALREEALVLYRQAGDEYQATQMLRLLGTLLLPLGELEQAKACCDEALASAEALGDERGLTFALVDKGICLAWDDKLAEALVVWEDALQRFRALEWMLYLVGQLEIVAAVQLRRGDLAQAQANFEEALQIARQHQVAAAQSLFGLAAISARQGNRIRAAKQLATAERWLRETGEIASPVLPWREEARTEARTAVSSQLTADELEVIRREIDAMTLEDAIDAARETQASNAGAKSLST